MAINLLRIDSTASRLLLIAAAIACVLFVWITAKWNFANAVSSRADQKDIVELAVGLGPDDPQTHFAAAVIYQKTFDEADVKLSLAEYEKAAALSPNNYLCWLELGHARERNGDSTGADLALKKALDLAPNYSDVQWAYGNALLRAGRPNEAFEQIRKSASAKPEFGNAAVVIAMQTFDGDANIVRQALGNTSRINAAIMAFFNGQKRFADAATAWEQIPMEERRTSYKDAGTALATTFLGAKQFRSAARIFGDISEMRKPIGIIEDGGFETGVKLTGAGAFEWQIASGAEPQVALSTAQKHSGNSSLLFVFNTMQAADFRPVVQTVAVEPGANYEFEAFCRTELKTQATVRWEVADAMDGKVLAKTEPIAANTDWFQLKVKFIVPITSDGVTIRLVRADCQSSVCPINGRLWCDDISIHQQ